MQISIALFLNVSPLQCSALQILATSAFGTSNLFLLQLSKTPLLCLRSPSLSTVQKMHPGQNCADHTVQLTCLFQELHSCSACCPSSVHSCLNIFSPVFCKGANPVPVVASWQEAEFSSRTIFEGYNLWIFVLFFYQEIFNYFGILVSSNLAIYSLNYNNLSINSYHFLHG